MASRSMTSKRGVSMEIERLGDDDLLRCPMCLDAFQTPRALACLHTFCEPCLELYLTDCKVSATDGKLTKVDCPLCNHPTVPIDTRKHPHSMVKDFPINHFILPHTDLRLDKHSGKGKETQTEHVSSLSQKARKRVQFERYCGSCSERSVHTEAVVYCNDCGDFQCSECVENHSKMNFLTRHKFVRAERVSDGSQYTNVFVLLQVSAKDGKLTKVDCPLCNHPTVPIDTRKHPHSMVKDFPINHFILPHTDLRLDKLSATGKETQTEHASSLSQKARKRVQFVRYCGSCSERSVHTEAVVYCNDCGDFQCSECVENHNKMNFLTRHKFVRTERVSDGSQYTNFYGKHNNCKFHQKEEMRFYCEDHDFLLCSTCAFESHKACDLLNDFDGLGQRLKDTNQHKSLRKNLKGLQIVLKDVLESARTNNYTMMRESEEIPKRIQLLKTKMLRMFQYMEDAADKSIRKHQTDYGKKNSERGLKCKQIISAIESSCAALDTLILHGTNHQLFSTFQILKDHMRYFHDLVDREKEQLECVTIQLKVDETLEKLVSMTEALGSVYVDSVVPDLGELPTLMVSKTGEHLPEEKPVLVKSAEIKEKDDHVKKYCIAVCCMKKVVALIFEVRNRTWLSYKLVLIDARTLADVISVDIKRTPKNIININATTVAITYPNQGMIEFYTYIPKKKKSPASINLDHTIKCDIRDTILAKYKTSDFALSTGNFFGILSHEGELKQTFYYSVTLRAREEDFWSTQLEVLAMCVDAKRKRLYVASANPDKLYSLTLDGRVMFEYEVKATVSSVDTDKDGSIYLCCHRNTTGKISKVSPSTGKLVNDISLEMDNPWLLCFDKKGERFYVLEHAGNLTKVKKYRFPEAIEDEDSGDDL